MRQKRGDIERVAAEFEGWRARRKGRVIPAGLWKAAVGLLDRYSSTMICRRLRLNQSRFRDEREGRGREVVVRRGGAARAAQELVLTRRSATASATAGRFVQLPALGIAVANSPTAGHGAEKFWGSAGCRITIESGRGTLTLVTTTHDAALADAVCRFVLGGLDGDGR